MRKCLIALIMLCLPVSVFGADHYVLDGGSGDGSAWNNAWDELPITFVRGDTYYVGDGTYPNQVYLNTPASGTDVIYIKKATAAVHGTETGWLSAYGDGQATFTDNIAVLITTDYWEWDGQVGAGQGTTPYGFKMFSTIGSANSAHGFDINDGADYITIKYTEYGRPSIAYKGRAIDMTKPNYQNGASSYITVQNCYFHDVFGVFFYIYGDNNITIDNVYMVRNQSTTATHAEGIQARYTTDLTIKNSWFEDIQGTGVIICGSGASYDWDIYGNIFYATADPGSNSWGHGHVADNASSSSLGSISFHNNTIYFVSRKTSGHSGIRNAYHIAGKTNYTYNNLWVNAYSIYQVNVTHGYNDYYNSTYSGFGGSWSPGATDGEWGSGDPFTDAGGQDFTLASATVAGTATSFTSDRLGVTRGADGTWDRGAFEFVEGGNQPPTNISGFAGVPSITTIDLNWDNPGSVDFDGTMIRASTSSYPADSSAGVLVTNQIAAPSSTDSYQYTGLDAGTIHYLTGFAYDDSANFAGGTQLSVTTDPAVQIIITGAGVDFSGDFQ